MSDGNNNNTNGDGTDDLDSQIDEITNSQQSAQASSRPASATGDSDQAGGDDTAPAGIAGRVGSAIGATIAWLALLPVRFLKAIVWGVLSRFPGRKKVYVKMIKAGYKGMYKKTGAHVVANTIYGDSEMVPRPAVVDDETGNLETSNDEEWTVENGLDPVFVGDVPVVTGGADNHELTSHISARIAEAVDYSGRRFQTVKETSRGVEPVEPKIGDNGAANGHAATDGGAAPTSPLSRSMTFDDIWVDTSNPEPENDGWIISMDKAYALHWDQAGSEEMENQETRGILAAKDPRKNQKRMIIIIAAVLGAFCLGLFGPALATQIAGGAASGAGGGIGL